MRRSRSLSLSLAFFVPALLAIVAVACGDDDATTSSTPDGGGIDVAVDQQSPPGDSSTNDAAGDAGGIVRGPVSLDFDPQGNGDPISLFWDEATSVLFIADNRNDQIWSWTDADGFKKLVKVPNDPAATDAGRTNLGQIVKLPDGRLVVPRFGFGEQGAILYVDPATGDGGTVPGLPANRRRVALAVGPDGKLWGGYFFRPNQVDDAGVVSQIALTGEETEYSTGWLKPVSVLVSGNRLLVAEQIRSGGSIVSLPLDGGTDITPFAAVPSPDTLVEGPNGSILTGQFQPLADGGPLQIRQAWADGGYNVVFPDAGFAKPQGLAYDKKNKRVFVADSNGTVVRTLKIFPLE